MNGDGEAVTVLLFAGLRQAAGTGRVDLAWRPGLTVADAADALEAEHDGLRLRGSLVAVNEAYAAPDRALRGGDTLAFLPPVSGG